LPRAAQYFAHFGNAFSSFLRRQRFVEFFASREEHESVLFVPALVQVIVEVNRVTASRERAFLAVFQRFFLNRFG